VEFASLLYYLDEVSRTQQRLATSNRSRFTQGQVAKRGAHAALLQSATYLQLATEAQ